MPSGHSFKDNREFAKLIAKSGRSAGLPAADIQRLIYIVEHWFINTASQTTETGGVDVNVGEGPDIDIVYPSVIGRGGDQIITFDNTGLPVAEYAPTSAGFDLALAASAPIIWLYAYTIDGDHTIPASYHVIGNQRDTSILSGLITLSSGSTLTNLSVVRTANDANALIGVGGPGTGTGYLYGCKITCTQSGAGAAYAIAANGGLYLDQGDIHATRCELEATSVGGVGYCGLSSAGRIYGRWNKTDVYTTDRWLVS
jgi:hypothetical protein